MEDTRITISEAASKYGGFLRRYWYGEAVSAEDTTFMSYAGVPTDHSGRNEGPDSRVEHHLELCPHSSLWK